MSSIKEGEISFLEEIENLEVNQNVKFNTASTGTVDLIFTSNKRHETGKLFKYFKAFHKSC